VTALDQLVDTVGGHSQLGRNRRVWKAAITRQAFDEPA
jgi:hypothetical protein